MKTTFVRWLSILGVVLATGFVVGCGSPDGAQSPKTPVTSRPESRLRGGDPVVVRLDFGGNQGTQSYEAVIDENGEISLPLIGRLQAAGSTPAELSERIQASYVPRFYVRCNATVLASIRFFYVGGEIRSPGRYNWTEDVTLLKAINTAGGFSEFANRRKVEVTRGKEKFTFDTEEIRQRPEKDVSIQPGDSLYVPRSIF
jgi:polysaccharide export outer membrane protein